MLQDRLAQRLYPRKANLECRLNLINQSFDVLRYSHDRYLPLLGKDRIWYPMVVAQHCPARFGQPAVNGDTGERFGVRHGDVQRDLCCRNPVPIVVHCPIGWPVVDRPSGCMYDQYFE